MSDHGSSATGSADSSSTPAESGQTTCETCGSLIDEHEWHPIRSRTDASDELRVYSFCSAECVESWETDVPR